MRTRMSMAGAIALASLFLVASIGTAAQKAADRTAKATQAFEKLSKELYPKAKQEGSLVVYTVWDVDDIKAILDAFMKRYPGINAIYWQARNPEIVTRVLTEFRGGQVRPLNVTPQPE